MSFHSIPPFEAPQDVNVDTIRREVGDAIGPFMEPFYIVPQSTLLGTFCLFTWSRHPTLSHATRKAYFELELRRLPSPRLNTQYTLPTPSRYSSIPANRLSSHTVITRRWLQTGRHLSTMPCL